MLRAYCAELVEIDFVAIDTTSCYSRTSFQSSILGKLNKFQSSNSALRSVTFAFVVVEESS